MQIITGRMSGNPYHFKAKDAIKRHCLTPTECHSGIVFGLIVSRNNYCHVDYQTYLRNVIKMKIQNIGSVVKCQSSRHYYRQLGLCKAYEPLDKLYLNMC